MDPEKHARYLESYKPNDYFWGLGIENETYLQFSSNAMNVIHATHKRERYSVNYFEKLNPDYKEHIKQLVPQEFAVPIYINAHSFTRTDVSGVHATTYEKVPKPTKGYKGQSLHEFLSLNNDYFLQHYQKNYTFDGDTIEFMTQNFYNAKINDVINHSFRSVALIWRCAFIRQCAVAY